MNFEKTVLRRLAEKYGDQLEIGPWFHFEQDGRERWCSPDAILHHKRPVVLEIKSGHTEKAWFQLHTLYIPVLEAFYKKSFRACEVVKWYCPRTPFPGAIELVSSVEKAPYIGTGVHIYSELVGV